jgi:hypothetical protein
MDLEYLTLVHVAISLVGIASGFGVLSGLLAATLFPRWTAVFLATTVTGFFFPFRGFTPAFTVGLISLLPLAAANYALYVRRLAGAWRKTFVVSALTALYLNVFVLIAQMFLKVPPLSALAPTQSEPPFLVTQLLVLALFIPLAIAAAKRFRSEPIRAT